VTAALWAGGALVALIAAAVAVSVEREKVARKNYRGAQQLVRTTRRVWFAALWTAIKAVALAMLGLGIVWLASGGRQR